MSNETEKAVESKRRTSTRDKRCRHFTGVCNDANHESILHKEIGPALDGVHRGQCEAMVFYNDVCDLSGGRGIRLPCLGGDGEALPCAKREWQTPEEIAAEEAEIVAAMERFAKSTDLIMRIKKQHKGESWRGVETCPVCAGKLHITHAAINGHVWGQCETEDCLSWME